MGCGSSTDPGQHGPPSPVVVNVKPKKKADSSPAEIAAVESKGDPQQQQSGAPDGESSEPISPQPSTQDQRPDQAQLEAQAKQLQEKRDTLKEVTDVEIAKAEALVDALQQELDNAAEGEKDQCKVLLEHQQSELEQMHELQSQVLDGIEQDISAIHSCLKGLEVIEQTLQSTQADKPTTEQPKSTPLKIITETPRKMSGDSAAEAETADTTQSPTAASALTPRIAALTTQVSVPEAVIRNLANISGTSQCFSDVQMSQTASQRGAESLLNFLEAAAAFSSAKSTDDRVSFMFDRWDLDNDGYLGAADLQAALGPDECDASMAATLVLEMGGDQKGLTREALITYVKQHPDIEQALILRTREGGGLASQLAARPLVVMVLLQSRGNLETLVRELDTFAVGAPLSRKLERLFDVLDRDSNGALEKDEVAKISKECSGEEAEQMLSRLEDWITQNAAKSDDGFISREDFLQFAALHIPGVEGALTVSFSVDELTTS